ncbi:hypothetical protein [Micromonospora zamorensis]|uniref:hypothetical protein n=1 Tax=Micromonospora zamorensis TaxID=709883 RepID=UPI002ED0AC58|nr:hypothetical protein OG886_10795 [Micromonospora zamorensis]
MVREHVLAKVEADLRRGHVHPAMQRLASLNAALGCLVAGVTGLVLVALTVVGLITVLRWAW